MKEYVGVSDVIDVPPDWWQTTPPSELKQVRGNRPMRRCSEPAYTLTRNKSPVVIEWTYEAGDADRIGNIVDANWRLTVEEFSRLQSLESFEWPDFTKKEINQLAGNAVPPPVAEAIADSI